MSVARQSGLILLCLIVTVMGLPASAPCSTIINLTVQQISKDDDVSILIQNDSDSDLKLHSVDLNLNDQKHTRSIQEVISPRQTRTIDFKVISPTIPGSYPLTSTVRYLNENRILSIRHVGSFYLQSPALLDASCIVEKNAVIGKEGQVVIHSSQPELWKLILPDELDLISEKIDGDTKVFTIKSRVTNFRNTYPIFAIAEQQSDGKHSMSLCQGLLSVDTTNSGKSDRGRTSSEVLIIIAAISLTVFCFANRHQKIESRLTSAIMKFSSRMFLLSISYYALRNADVWLEYSLGYIRWKPYSFVMDYAINNFRGSNYEYFFRYFVDPYFLACSLLMFPFFYYLNTNKTLDQDKYTSLIRSFLSVKNLIRGEKPYWSRMSKLGLLTFMVKLFYIPLLTTWVINNSIHQKNLINMFSWNFEAVNVFLVALFIYIDTAIFCFGYLFEFSKLKNEIKTVDPTVLGWLVCLWCYPPFNAFSFRIFDYPVLNIAHTYPNWVQVSMTFAITLLWGIFAWASIALGFKASNLTSRGIVWHGPYRFVRHPAYAAKLAIWLIQGIVFGQYYLGLILGFILIYALRAWTEERHLSLDPDYHEYKRKVRYAFIPGVF